MILFAADACLSYQHSDPPWVNSVIIVQMRKVYMWLQLINFLFTVLKLNYCFLTKLLKNLIKVIINRFNIEQREGIKYLGVVLDVKLN